MVIKTRAERREFFSSSLFSDSAWDILLELFAASLEGRQLSMTAVGLGPGIPTTTVLRWSAVLSQEGLICRREDPLDRRRVFLDLSAEGFDAMMSYFDRLEEMIAARSTVVSPLLPRGLGNISWTAAARDEGQMSPDDDPAV